MIGHLQGTILFSSPEKVVLDVHGVGYQVHIPLSTFSEIQHVGIGGSIALHIHTHVRESAIELFGFSTPRERLLFEKLISVSGIGPKLARVILSGMPSTDLLASLASSDIARLSTIPGVGKKTAERMVVELKDRVQELTVDLPVAPAEAEADDLVVAMVNLGYKVQDAKRAVEQARKRNPDGEFEEILKASLSALSRA